MAVYFMPKNHIITKAVNFRPLPNKWSVKWTITSRRSKSTTQSGVSDKVTTIGQQNTNQKKGKLSKLKNLHKKWSWKAGAGWTIISVLDWWLLAAGWFTWSGLLMRWTPIGVCLLAVLDWHFHTKRMEKNGLPITASPLQVNAYCSLPLRAVSRCWGWMADCSVPTSLRPYVYGLYANAFKVNMDEADNPDLKYYRSLSEFFTRSLKDGVRLIDPSSPIVSPADGKVLHFGLATNEQIEQVKGVNYKLEAFLGPPNWVDNKESHTSYVKKIKFGSDDKTALYQCVIYLAPGDYHRFHSPAVWEPKLRRHFAGELLSVSPKIASLVPGLFCLNERALYIGEWKYGFFSFTAVGATNVGSVQIYFDQELKTNKSMGLKVGSLKNKSYDELPLQEHIHLSKGDLVGQFNMGSTIVLIFEAPADFKFTIEPGQKVQVGEKLGVMLSGN